MNKYLYKYNGIYWGYIIKSRIYNKLGIYIGWVDRKNKCWNIDGDYIGELVDDIHIIRKNIYVQPISMIPRIPRVVPVKIADRPNIKPKVLKNGYHDVLEKY